MALDLTAGRRGLDALGKVIERWIAHLLPVEVEVESLTEATGVNLTWYVGLDAEATAIGDILWHGEELDQAARERIIGLYRLNVRDAEMVLDTAKGEPIPQKIGKRPRPYQATGRKPTYTRAQIAEACLLSYENRQPMHGYKVTREAAMAAFAKSWRRE
jgi:hypothetical protein